jgi:[acyl-carrier-protein] S-malonyltransferase
MKTAWVFPGQGSQAVGMGAALAQMPSAQEKLAQAASILGWSVLEVCQGELEQLSQTQFTQPCLYTVECLLVDGLREQGLSSDLMPAYVAGHSLGEYVALYAAGVFDFADGLRLVQSRSQLMAAASDGMMAALMGFDRAQLDGAIAATEGVVLANDNNPGQVVISGTPEGVKAVMAAIKTKRAVPLNVSGAFHSPLMAGPAKAYQAVLDAVVFRNAQVPVLSNVEPLPETDGEVLRQRLAQQMTGSVRWRETSLALAQLGVEKIVEIGPGKVLTGLIKRTCEGMRLENLETLETLETIEGLATVSV